MGSASDLQLSDSWVAGRPDLRWRSTVTTDPPHAVASGSSLLEVDPGCALARHTDSAEETVVVVAGRAEVEIDGARSAADAGEVVLIPERVPHQVANAGGEVLRFVAVYAAADVVTRYEAPVQPDGEQERQTIG